MAIMRGLATVQGLLGRLGPGSLTREKIVCAGVLLP